MNKDEKREIDLIDFIVADADRKELQSMSEHPQYPELKELQDKLYNEEKK